MSHRKPEAIFIGTVLMTSGYNENPNSPNLPTLVMGNEDYGRIYRTSTIDHIPVILRINIHNEFYPAGRTVYNVVGELPGTDKSDEVVMAGGHFDSWNPATGATDNAAGGFVAVEALRLIQTLKLPHRRTIRVALWSGEEEGLYGSIAYVAQHFGSAENPKPEWFKLDAYLNSCAHEALNADTSEDRIQLPTGRQYAIGSAADGSFERFKRIRCEVHCAMEGDLHRL